MHCVTVGIRGTANGCTHFARLNICTTGPIGTLNTDIHSPRTTRGLTLHFNFSVATINMRCTNSDHRRSGCTHNRLAGTAIGLRNGRCGLMSFNTVISGSTGGIVRLSDISLGAGGIPTGGLFRIGSGNTICATIIGSVPGSGTSVGVHTHVCLRIASVGNRGPRAVCNDVVSHGIDRDCGNFVWASILKRLRRARGDRRRWFCTEYKTSPKRCL